MQHNDYQLIQRILAGDDDAFSLIVTKYQQQVHALAWRIVKDFHIAEEITQDTFLIAYKDLKKLKDPQSLAGWLSVITRRQCYAWLRKKRLWTQSLEHLEQTDNEQLEEVVYSEYVVEEKERTAAESQREVVKKLLAKLEESERTVVTLHYFGEMSCSEIGEFLGVSANTIKSRLRRAQQRLKKQEPIIKEALEHFKITPNLTENIMREIDKTDPITPSGGKPFAPWLVAASTLVVMLIMLGFGNSKNLALFQQPYNLDANSEIAVEIVEAPIVENLELELDRRREVGRIQVRHVRHVSAQQPDNTPLRSAETGKETNMENYPQWNLPETAEARLGKGGAWSMEFSPDGTQLALSCPTGVWLYDVETGKEQSLFPGRRGSLAFSPDGRFLAKSGDNIQLWELATQRQVLIQDDFPDTNVLRFSNDSKTLIYLGKSGNEINRLHVDTGEITVTKMGPKYQRVTDPAFTEDKIAIGNYDGKLELWDTTTGEKLYTLKESGREVRMPTSFVMKNRALIMKFSPDGTRLATGNLDASVQIWDTITGEELITLQKPVEEQTNPRVIQNGIVKNPMQDERLGRPSSLAFSPDGTLLACGSQDFTIKVWNTVTGELLMIFTGHVGSVDMLAFSPNGKTLASEGADGTVRFWDVNTRKAIKTRIVGHMWIITAAFLGDDAKLGSVTNNGIITLWDLNNFQKKTFKTKGTLEEPLYSDVYGPLMLSPDGTLLANHGIQSDPSKPNYGRDVLRLTDVNTGRELKTFPNSYGKTFSPDGKIIASFGGNKIHLLNTETGEKRKIIIAEEGEDDTDEHTPMVSAIEFSPDGKKIVSGTDGGLVQIWDVKSGLELSSFFEEQSPIDGSDEDPIRTFAFSSDGSLLAVGSGEKIRLLGSTKQPHFNEVVFTSREYIDTFIFSPDDTVLIVAIGNGNIELWDVATGNKLTSLDGHSESVEDLKFSPNNKTLLSVGGGNILLWDWEKILKSASDKIQEPETNVEVYNEEQATENELQFIENSSQPARSVERILTQGEFYLANEWYEAALEQFRKYLHPMGYPPSWNVRTSPAFHRMLFARIGKASKDIQDKEGFTDMVNKLIELSPDSLSIQLNAHLVLAKFYQEQDMVENAEAHIQKIDLLIADLSTQDLNLQFNAYLSMADNYRESGNLDKAGEYIQKIDKIAAELNPDDPRSLRLQLVIHIGLAEFYREHGNLEKADEYIKKTGFVTEDAWMVLGPFDNAGGIGYDTAYIPEDITEIDLNAKYDGLNGDVSWEKFTDEKFDGYIHFGEKHVDWQVSYSLATVNSPDAREVQFRFDSDDQGKVWLNGEEVFSHTKTFMAIVDTYTIPVKLKQGENSILVKVCNEQGGWAFFLRITDQNGQSFDDLIINRAIQNKE